MANDKQPGITRRGFLTTLAAAGAGAAASSFLPDLDKLLPGATHRPDDASGLKAEGFALVSDAGQTGRLIQWGPGGVAEAAEPSKRAKDPKRHLGEPYQSDPSRQWAMVIDLAKCNGCGDCQVACNEFHRVPTGQEWIKIYQLKDHENGTPYWFPRVCMQCDNAPCVKVCPVGATYKREDGLVLLDQDRCIGCRFCLAACPYSARYFNWSEPANETPAQKREPYDLEKNTPHRKGVAEKCLFCPSMIREGKLPACAAACPMNAIYMGDRNEDAVTNRVGETLRLRNVMKEGAYRAQEELGTEPRVYYLPPRRRQYAPPPEPTGKGA